MKSFNYQAIFTWAATLTTIVILFGFDTSKEKSDDTLMGGPWENMGTNIRQVCDVAYLLEYEWGVTYNNSAPILRVTCNSWNSGQRVCTYPAYPTGDVEPFDWGGACWIWDTGSALDNPCSVAYHGYYKELPGRIEFSAGNGCNSLPTVWRRKL
jgi:hypothetical protein